MNRHDDGQVTDSSGESEFGGEAPKVLVSACLLGQPVRFDGASKPLANSFLDRLVAAGRVVPVCPEVAGGLSIPRAPAEIVTVDGRAYVRTESGIDVTASYQKGANVACQLAHQHGIKLAILKARSPSCGASQVYDGSFSRTLVEGEGITTHKLRAAGVRVFSEEELTQAEAYFETLCDALTTEAK